jgi:hypothetical protein
LADPEHIEGTVGTLRASALDGGEPVGDVAELVLILR